jgi:radical SAM protein with 4Fe4S-binding SPASM domain
MKKIPLFPKLEIETSSFCNKSCSTCLRSCYPDKTRISSWLKQNFLDEKLVYDIINQAVKLSFKGELGLSHYNEPVLDNRIWVFGKYAKEKNVFSKITFCSNGDFLDNMEKFDGIFDEIIVSREPEDFENLFLKTKIRFTGGKHVIKHFSPDKNLKQTIEQMSNKPCLQGYQGMYINHLGEMLMCCTDLIGHFNLGNVKENTLEELWYSEKHQNLLLNLEKENSRIQYSHCSICPLPTKYK